MNRGPLFALVLLLCSTGCAAAENLDQGRVDTSTVTRDAGTPDAHETLAVGATAPLRIYAHCGFEFTDIDGDLWRTRMRDDGQGNPPHGWPQVVTGTIERVAADKAVFVGDNVRVRAVFRPAPNATYMCA